MSRRRRKRRYRSDSKTYRSDAKLFGYTYQGRKYTSSRAEKVQTRQLKVHRAQKTVSNEKARASADYTREPRKLIKRVVCEQQVRKKRRAYFGFRVLGIKRRLKKHLNRFTLDKLCRRK